MWNCPKCVERLDDDFDLCWQCGTDREGNEDAAFVSADESEVIYDPAKDGEISSFDDLHELVRGTGSRDTLRSVAIVP